MPKRQRGTSRKSPILALLVAMALILGAVPLGTLPVAVAEDGGPSEEDQPIAGAGPGSGQGIGENGPGDAGSAGTSGSELDPGEGDDADAPGRNNPDVVSGGNGDGTADGDKEAPDDLDLLQVEAEPAVWTVDPKLHGENGDCDNNTCPTIQSAIDAAKDGDTINVLAGVYEENVVIDKKVRLVSKEGWERPIIKGNSDVPGLGTVYVTGETEGVQIGDVGHGFTIVGIDGPPAIEKAAVYFEGKHEDAQVIGNKIEAAGDYGLLTEYSATITNLTVTHNEFAGMTFNGEKPGGDGFGEQFSTPNVPRQLVTIGGGSGGGTSNVTFTNNEITGIAGGENEEGREQGNTLVTIDARGATIAHNVFKGTTTRFATSLRARGTDTDITDNTFISEGLTPTTGHILLGEGTLGEEKTLANLVAANTFDKGVFFENGTGVGVSIQGAIAGADEGETIVVLAGEYNENVVIGKPLTLRGAGPATVIAPEKGNSITVKADSVSLQGFTLDGAATTSARGIAIANRVTNAKITDVVVTGWRTGIFMDPSSSATITGLKAHNNLVGLAASGTAGLTIDNSEFSHNEQEAIGIGDYNAPGETGGVTIKGSTFVNNGRGIQVYEGADDWAGGPIAVTRSSFVDTGSAIVNDNSSAAIDATRNWWGHPTGPTHPNNPRGVGSQVTGENVTVIPWYANVDLTVERSSNPAPGGSGPAPTPPTPPVVLGGATETIDPAQDTQISTGDGRLTIAVPAGATPSGATITVAPLAEEDQPTPGTGMVKLGEQVFEILMEDEAGNPIRTFDAPLVLTFSYDRESLPANTREEDLQVFYWDEVLGAWILVPSERDPATGTITATVDHLTVFAVMAAAGLKIPSDLKDHWSQSDVLKLVSLGVVHGFEDGTYKPEGSVTRAQFAKLLVEAVGLTPGASQHLDFTDAVPDWAAGYVATAVQAGLVTGYDDGTFRADDLITREAMAVMVARALGMQPSGKTNSSFIDSAEISDWARDAVALATREEVIRGFEDGTFRPQATTTRGEAATLVARLLSSERFRR